MVVLLDLVVVVLVLVVLTVLFLSSLGGLVGVVVMLVMVILLEVLLVLMVLLLSLSFLGIAVPMLLAKGRPVVVLVRVTARAGLRGWAPLQAVQSQGLAGHIQMLAKAMETAALVGTALPPPKVLQLARISAAHFTVV